MATSSFNTVFVLPKETLREMARDMDKPRKEFNMPEDMRKSLSQSREIFEKCARKGK